MHPKRRLLIPVNLGTPAAPTPEAVREFLGEFLADPDVIDVPAWLWKPILNRMILRRRPQRVAELYASIWTDEGSPLEVGTRRIAAGLQALVDESVEVRWAYRYGARSVTRRLAEWVRPETEEIIVVPLYAQRTSSTTGTVIEETRRVATQLGIADRVRFRFPDADDKGYVLANVDRCRQAIAAAEFEPEHLMLSFHGIPKRYDRREGRTYSSDCERSAAAIVEALNWDPDRATLCFQSKFGPEPWLQPTTAKLLAEMPARGVRRLAIMTPGFLTEGLETLEEIGSEGAEIFREAGGSDYLAVPTAQDHPALLATLAGYATAE